MVPKRKQYIRLEKNVICGILSNIFTSISFELESIIGAICCIRV